MAQNEPTISPRVAQYSVLFTSRLLSFFALLQGLSIILGGESRWSSRAFAVALLFPGSPPSWGVVLGVGGIASLIGSYAGKHRLITIGHFICSAWSVFLCLSFALAAFLDELASITGVWAYAFMAVAYALFGVTYKEARKSAVQCNYTRQPSSV